MRAQPLSDEGSSRCSLKHVLIPKDFLSDGDLTREVPQRTHA